MSVKFLILRRTELDMIKTCTLVFTSSTHYTSQKDFAPCGKMSVSDVFLNTEFKHVSRTSLPPTPFTLHQTM